MSLNRDIVYLLGLCDELLLHIFAFLDVPELLSASRVRQRPSLYANPRMKCIIHAVNSDNAPHDGRNRVLYRND